jgi:hypothetical protein
VTSASELSKRVQDNFCEAAVVVVYPALARVSNHCILLAVSPVGIAKLGAVRVYPGTFAIFINYLNLFIISDLIYFLKTNLLPWGFGVLGFWGFGFRV